jgi:hypothetical protein
MPARHRYLHHLAHGFDRALEVEATYAHARSGATREHPALPGCVPTGLCPWAGSDESSR